MSKTTLTLTASHALLAARTALANCTDDWSTPVLMGARFRTVDGRLEVTATDRYTVSRHRLTPQRVNGDKELVPTKAPEGLEVIVPRTALLWLSRNAAAFKKTIFGGKVTLAFHDPTHAPGDDGRVVITVTPLVGDQEALSATFPLTAGNFPPVQRLIDDAEPIEVGVLSLSPMHLAKLNKFLPPQMPVRFEFTGKADQHKPGPIKWEVADLALDGLLQPNLLLR